MLLLALSLLACTVDAQPPAPEAPMPATPPEANPDPVPSVDCAATLDSTDARAKGSAVLVVTKATRRIGLYRDGALASDDAGPLCFSVGLGGAPTGTKSRQGDLRTPEGWYRTSDKPWSQFYGAIAVHYPNADDADRLLAAKVISDAQVRQIKAALAKDAKPPQTTGAGGEILIHGGGGSSDWTLGCVALDNPELDRIRAALPGTLVTDVWIRP